MSTLARIPKFALRYLTPDNNPGTSTCRGYLIPDDENIRAAWNESISILANDKVWDDSAGGLTALETAAIMAEVALYTDCNQTCEDDGMEIIVPRFVLQAQGAYTEFSWVGSYDTLELSMILQSDANQNSDGMAISLNGTTAGYVIFTTQIGSNDAVNSNFDNPSDGSFTANVTGNTGNLHSPVNLRLFRGAGQWQFMGDSISWRQVTAGQRYFLGGAWNSAVDINTIRVSPVVGNNWNVNCVFMLRGIPTP